MTAKLETGGNERRLGAQPADKLLSPGENDNAGDWHGGGRYLQPKDQGMRSWSGGDRSEENVLK